MTYLIVDNTEKFNLDKEAERAETILKSRKEDTKAQIKSWFEEVEKLDLVARIGRIKKPNRHLIFLKRCPLCNSKLLYKKRWKVGAPHIYSDEYYRYSYVYHRYRKYACRSCDYIYGRITTWYRTPGM